MRWLLAPNPHAWESLGQWVKRIGQQYGYPSVESFMEQYGFHNLTSADLFYSPSEDALNVISRNTGYTPLLLSRRTCTFFGNLRNLDTFHSCKLEYVRRHVVTDLDAPSLFKRRDMPLVFTKPHLHKKTAIRFGKGAARELTKLCASRPATSIVFSNLPQLVFSKRETIDICAIIIDSGCELFDMQSLLRVSNRLELDFICIFEMLRWHIHQRASRAAKPSRLRGRQPSLSFSEAADACRRFENGEKVIDIADRYGVARSTVYQYLKARSIVNLHAKLHPLI